MPAFKILVEATPGSAALCGFCKRIYPGPDQDHCAAFDGRRLDYVHQINDYVRLPECIAAEKAQEEGGGESDLTPHERENLTHCLGYNYTPRQVRRMRRLDQESEQATMTLTEDIRAIVERVKNLGPEWRHTANVLTDALGAAERAQNARLRYLATCIDEAKGRLAYHKQEIRTLPEQIAKWEAERARLEASTAVGLMMGREAPKPAPADSAEDPFVPGLPPLRLREVWAEWEVLERGEPADLLLVFSTDGRLCKWAEGKEWFAVVEGSAIWDGRSMRPRGKTRAEVEAMADAAEKQGEPEKPTLLDLRGLKVGTVCEATGDIRTYLGRCIKPGEVFRIFEPDDGMGDKHPTIIEIEFAGACVPALVPARVVEEPK